MWHIYKVVLGRKDKHSACFSIYLKGTLSVNWVRVGPDPQVCKQSQSSFELCIQPCFFFGAIFGNDHSFVEVWASISFRNMLNSRIAARTSTNSPPYLTGVSSFML